MVESLFSEKEQQFLAILLKNEVRFMVVGLTAAALQGAPIVTEDVDLWFERPGNPAFLRACDEAGVTYIPPEGHHPPMFSGPGAVLLDIVTHMHGLGSFSEELENVTRIQTGSIDLPVLSLERIIASKESLGRQRDHLVLPALRATLAALRGQEE